MFFCVSSSSSHTTRVSEIYSKAVAEMCHIMFVIGFNARGEIYCFETKIYWFARPNLLVKGIEG